MNRTELLGKYGALLSLIEIGLGSLLHSLSFPFSGIFLSLNQGYLLCRVSIITQDKTLPYSISNIAAVFKSLSPAGNKLGPMLSLSMQGLLFSTGLILGINPVGLSLGMILLSVWSFIQPLITYYLFFGEKLFNAAEFLAGKLGLGRENILWFLAGLILSKALIGVLLALFAWKSKGVDPNQEHLATFAKPRAEKSGHPMLMALKDLLRPVFLLSLLTTATFIYFSQGAGAQMVWYLMRPVAFGFIFFYFSRTLSLDRLLFRLHGSRFEVFAKGCELALKEIRKIL